MTANRCADCGVEVRRVGARGPLPRRCPEHVRARDAALMRAKREAGHVFRPALVTAKSLGWGPRYWARRFEQLTARLRKCRGCARWYFRTAGRSGTDGCSYCTRECAFHHGRQWRRSNPPRQALQERIAI